MVKQGGRMCCVPKCYNSAWKSKHAECDGDRISLYYFPKDNDLRDKWVANLRIRKNPSKWSQVCNVHFTDEDFRYSRTGKCNKRFLKKTSVPSQCLPDISVSIPRSVPRTKKRSQLMLPGGHSRTETGVVSMPPMKRNNVVMKTDRDHGLAGNADRDAGAPDAIPVVNLEAVGIKKEPDSEPEETDEFAFVKVKEEQSDEHLPTSRPTVMKLGSRNHDNSSSSSNEDRAAESSIKQETSDSDETASTSVNNVLEPLVQIVTADVVNVSVGSPTVCVKSPIESGASTIESRRPVIENRQSDVESSQSDTESRHSDTESRQSDTETRTSGIEKILLAKQNMTCKVCGLYMVTASSLRYHMLVHNGEYPFDCSSCSYKCRTKSQLSRHMVMHAADLPFKCTLCSYKSRWKDCLISHALTHTGELPFSCLVCSHKFRDKSNMRRHMTIHTGEQPYQCRECPFKSRMKSILKTHALTHAEQLQQRCQECSFTCRHKYNLKEHMFVHKSNEELPFQCRECPIKCRSAAFLRRHTLTHTDEGIKKCEDCSYTCRSKSDIRSHMLVHTRELPFHCRECLFSCRQKSKLVSHNKSKHGKNVTA